jgi:hypothetical protein
VSSVPNSCDVQNDSLKPNKRCRPLWKVHFIAGRSGSIMRPVSTSPTVIFRRSRIASSQFLNLCPVSPSLVFYFNPWLSVSLSSSSALQPWVGLGLLLRSRNNIFLWGGVVSLTPTPNLEDQGIPFRLGHHP